VGPRHAVRYPFQPADQPRLSPGGYPVGRVCVGFDVGQAQDFSALCAQQPEQRPDPFAVGPKADTATFFRVLHLERFPLGMSYQDQLDLVAARCLEIYERTQYEAPLLRVDASGNGRAPAETLARMSDAGDPFEVLRVTIVAGANLSWSGPGAVSWGKDALVARLQRLLGERRLLVSRRLANVQVLERELADYERRQRASGQIETGALKTGSHDDPVTAVALACLDDGPVVQDLSSLQNLRF
jgi:hypothetical protein